MTISRRTFIAAGAAAGAGLIIGVSLPESWSFAQEEKKTPSPNPFVAYIHVKPSGQISLIVAKSEMGQGIRTGLAMCLAEELEVELDSVSVEQAETRPDIYAHLGTGGSGSTEENFMPLRRAGATVRELMITAAAAKWSVPRNECIAEKSAVLHRASSHRAGYG
jgi:CO/xanthine dehydrogenase Mo-binding subunit